MRFFDVMVNGKRFSFPSVTGIIELARERGYLIGDQWLTYNEETLTEGKQAHKLVEYVMRGGNFTAKEELKQAWFDLPEAMKNVLRAVMRWQKATGYKSRQSEFEVASIVHGFVGHPDDIGIIKQHVWIIDWTTGDINTGKLVQLGSYYVALIEQYSRKRIYGARAVKLDKKTGNYSERIIELPELDSLGNDFITIRQRIGII